MGPVSGLLWLAASRWRSSAASFPAPRRSMPCSSGASPASPRLRRRLHHPADPVGARSSLGAHAAMIVGAAAADRRRAVADRRRGLLPGADARPADALRRVLLPAALRGAARRAGDRHLRVAVRHRGRPAPPARAPRAGLRRRLRRPRGHRSSSSSAAWSRPSACSTRWPGSTRSPGSRTGARSTRRSTARFGAPFTVLLADIDFFKQINDRFGHTTGDRVLRELAAHAVGRGPRGRLPGPDRRRRVRARRPGRRLRPRPAHRRAA